MNVDEFCKLWGLSPHQGSFILNFASDFDIRAKDILELGGAMPKSLVIDYFGANSWTCLQSAEYSTYRQDNQVPSGLTDTTYKSVYCQAENYLENTPDSFDAIFSIAAFEHFLKLPEVIRKASNVLKQNGLLFTIFAPIWSGPYGNHFDCLIPYDQNNQKINARVKRSAQDIFDTPWDHLILRPSHFLRRYTEKFDRNTAEEITYDTFHSPQINRLHLEDYLQIFQESTLKLTQFQPLFGIVNDGDRQVSFQLQLLNRIYSGKGYHDFIHSGIKAILSK
jgi:SAM-dependent methyltransferase